MENQAENRQWYAIRVTYSRELMVKGALDSRGIESYIPMRRVERTVAGHKRKLWEPIIHNLIFIHASADCMRELKTCTKLPICYIMDRAARIPLVIPDRQMEDFIRIVAAQDGQAEILEAQVAALVHGDLVRVVEGTFAGVEGRYIRHKGRGRVAVEIENIATILTAYIPARSVVKIEASECSAAKPSLQRAAGSI